MRISFLKLGRIMRLAPKEHEGHGNGQHSLNGGVAFLLHDIPWLASHDAGKLKSKTSHGSCLRAVQPYRLTGRLGYI